MGFEAVVPARWTRVYIAGWLVEYDFSFFHDGKSWRRRGRTSSVVNSANIGPIKKTYVDVYMQGRTPFIPWYLGPCALVGTYLVIDSYRTVSVLFLRAIVCGMGHLNSPESAGTYENVDIASSGVEESSCMPWPIKLSSFGSRNFLWISFVAQKWWKKRNLIRIIIKEDQSNVPKHYYTGRAVECTQAFESLSSLYSSSIIRFCLCSKRACHDMTL